MSELNPSQTSKAAQAAENYWKEFENLGRPEGVASEPSRAHRLLVIMPENHLVEKETDARQVASSLAADPGHTVKLFLEGRRNENTAVEPQTEPFGVAGVNSGAVAKLYWPLVYAHSILRWGVVSSILSGDLSKALVHPEVKDLIEEVKIHRLTGSAVLVDDPNPLLTLQNALTSNINYAGIFLREYVSVGPSKLQNAFLSAQRTPRGQISNIWESILTDTFRVVGPKEIENFDHLSAEAAHLFQIMPRTFDRSAFDRLKTAVKNRDERGAYQIINPLLAGFRESRETTMAYFVARENFDVGVLNCGWNHATSKRFQELLGKSGISTRIYGIPGTN